MSAFTYGWKEKGIDNSFWLRFSPCTREPQSWKDELYAAACAIANRTTKPIWVCSSGGIDSEIACQAFYDQKIPFSVLTLAHAAGTNQHDIKYAIKWCEKNGVPQKIVTIDMEVFLSQGIDAFAKQYAAIHPFRYFQLKLLEMVEEMGGYAVLCSGEQIYQAPASSGSLSPNDLSIPLSNGTVVPLEWCRENNTEHEPYFYFSTPELCISYIRLPLVNFALKNPNTVFLHPFNVYTFKRVVYQSVWTKLEVRYKAHGFEGTAVLYQDTTSRLRDRFGSKYVPYNIPLISFEEQLTQRLR